MSTSQIRPGDTFEFTGLTKAPNDIVIQGKRVGVSQGTYGTTDVGIAHKRGVHRVAIVTTDTPTKGDLLYADVANGNRLTTTSTSNVACAYADETKGSGPGLINADFFGGAKA